MERVGRLHTRQYIDVRIRLQVVFKFLSFFRRRVQRQASGVSRNSFRAQNVERFSMAKEKKNRDGSDSSAAEVTLETRPEGVLIPVKAQPGAGRNEIRGTQDGALKVCVTQVPEKGKANKAIVDFLAKALKLRKSQLSLYSGELSSQKKFLATEIDE